ncbi:NADH dehydrogenase subunit 5 [Rhodotorula toruloides ATCC 204091]|nr:NADH dehydrogenase subunit 5 [Rhodotorula toruloides ATCC 204091]
MGYLFMAVGLSQYSAVCCIQWPTSKTCDA